MVGDDNDKLLHLGNLLFGRFFVSLAPRDGSCRRGPWTCRKHEGYNVWLWTGRTRIGHERNYRTLDGGASGRRRTVVNVTDRDRCRAVCTSRSHNNNNVAIAGVAVVVPADIVAGNNNNDNNKKKKSVMLLHWLAVFRSRRRRRRCHRTSRNQSPPPSLLLCIVYKVNTTIVCGHRRRDTTFDNTESPVMEQETRAPVHRCLHHDGNDYYHRCSPEDTPLVIAGARVVHVFPRFYPKIVKKLWWITSCNLYDYTC